MVRKKAIRDQVLERRMSTSQELLEIKSKDICKKLIKDEVYEKSELIFAYLNYKNEVNLTSFIERALEEGKRVAVPRVVDEQQSIMQFYVLDDLLKIAKGYKGILEPKEELKIAEISDCDMLLVPCVAFDNQCNRLGYGKGFYDRYLGSYPKLIGKTILVAYDLQEVIEIPTEKTDIKIKRIITESREIIHE